MHRLDILIGYNKEERGQMETSPESSCNEKCYYVVSLGQCGAGQLRTGMGFGNAIYLICTHVKGEATDGNCRLDETSLNQIVVMDGDR